MVRRQRFGGCGRISVTLRRAYCGQVEVLRLSDGARVPRVLVVKHLRVRLLCQRVEWVQDRQGLGTGIHWGGTFVKELGCASVFCGARAEQLATGGVVCFGVSGSLRQLIEKNQ